MGKYGYLAAGLLAMVAAPAMAEPDGLMPAYTLPLDTEATVSPAAMAYIESIKQRSADWSRTVTSIDAERIVAIVMADGVADSDEIDFLEELVSDRWTLNLIQSGGDGAVIAFTPLRSDSRGPIIAPLDGEWDSAWNGGGEGWQRIVGLYTSPHHHGVGRALSIVQRRMSAAWANSNIGNAYRPFRDLLSPKYSANMTLAPEQQRYGRWLLYYAAQRTDEAAERDMPDMLYSWLKPQ